MSPWTAEAARALTAPDEVRIVTRRRDGTLRRPVTIWVVGDGSRVFIRSTNGRTAAWFRWALATGTGRLVAGGTAHEVEFSEAAEDDLDRVDAAYRAKYARYASIVDHLVEPGPRGATLEVHPAASVSPPTS